MGDANPGAGPIPFGLLPDTAVLTDDGSLSIGGCSLIDLAATYGTPLFVYDETHLRNRCREAVAAFGYQNVVYATKAFLCKAMALLAYEGGSCSMSRPRANCTWRCQPAYLLTHARSTATTRASPNCAWR